MWGREFLDLMTEFPGVIKEPQQLFNVLQRLTPRMYSIATQPGGASERGAYDGARGAVYSHGGIARVCARAIWASARRWGDAADLSA